MIARALHLCLGAFCLAVPVACASTQDGAPPTHIESTAIASAPSEPSPSAAPTEAVPAAKPGELTLVSKRLVTERLTAPLSIEFHVSPAMAEAALVGMIQSTLEGYKNAKVDSRTSKVTFRVIELTSDDLVAAAKTKGLTEKPVKEDPNGPVDTRRGFRGFVLKYQKHEEIISFWPSESKREHLEFFLTSKMRELIALGDGVKTNVGVVTDKAALTLREASLAPKSTMNMANVLEEYFPYYDLVDVGLNAEIEPSLDGVVVTQRSERFTEAELKRLDTFLMRGQKSVAFFAGAATTALADVEMTAKIGNHGLNALLEKYGVQLRDEIVFDKDSALGIDAIGASGQPTKLVHPGILLLKGDRLDRSFASFRGLDSMPFPFASPLVALPDKQPEAKLRVVARTAASAKVNGGKTQSLKLNATFDGQPAKEVPVAIAIEGKVKSAFSKKSAEGTRIIVIASSEYLANPYARHGNGPPLPPQLEMMGPSPGDSELQAIAQPYAQAHFHRIFVSFKSTLDWMTRDDEFPELNALLLTK